MDIIEPDGKTIYRDKHLLKSANLPVSIHKTILLYNKGLSDFIWTVSDY